MLGARAKMHCSYHAEVSTVTHDAFIHVPHLHGRLTPADKSAMRVTREALAIYDERARNRLPRKLAPFGPKNRRVLAQLLFLSDETKRSLGLRLRVADVGSRLPLCGGQIGGR